MTDDLPTRLRATAQKARRLEIFTAGDKLRCVQACEEAADEIERLRAQNERFARLVAAPFPCPKDHP